MKEVIIDGKLYFQQQQCDIDKLPKQEFSKNMLNPKDEDDEKIYGFGVLYEGDPLQNGLISNDKAPS